LLFELQDGVFGNMDTFLFTNKGISTLKYINDVIDHILEAGIYMQFKKLRVHSVTMAKGENTSKIVY